jgi:hypothetical protein
MSAAKRLVYCHCAYAKVVPKKVKEEVLRRLGASEGDFEAVPDLCEMAARKDPLLGEYAKEENLEIIACFPRAVGWLFHASGNALPENACVHNMRESSADEIVSAVGSEVGTVLPPEVTT